MGIRIVSIALFMLGLMFIFSAQILLLGEALHGIGIACLTSGITGIVFFPKEYYPVLPGNIFLHGSIRDDGCTACFPPDQVRSLQVSLMNWSGKSPASRGRS
jgi:hypothetical protein